MLKTYMQTNGISQARASKDTGVSEMHIWRILHGHPITFKIAMKINEAYGLDVKELLAQHMESAQ